MRTKWGPLLVLCFTLLISQAALAQYTGGSYDGYGMGTSNPDISLPVELSTFTATASGDNVILHWRTETEVGNVGFSIYRSSTKDGDYTKIGWVDGAGDSGISIDYKFTDETVEQSETYFYYLEDIDISGEKNKSMIIEVVVPSAKPVLLIPKEFRLLQNFPNPFNPDTWLPYELAYDTTVTIRIYDLKGHLVRELDLGRQSASSYITKDKAAYWDGKNEHGQKVASGVYWYTLRAEGFSAIRRMAILK